MSSFFFPIALVLPFLPFFFSRPSIKSAFLDALRSPYVSRRICQEWRFGREGTMF
jgi:hypothetical protein